MCHVPLNIMTVFVSAHLLIMVSILFCIESQNRIDFIIGLLVQSSADQIQRPSATRFGSIHNHQASPLEDHVTQDDESGVSLTGSVISLPDDAANFRGAPLRPSHWPMD